MHALILNTFPCLTRPSKLLISASQLHIFPEGYINYFNPLRFFSNVFLYFIKSPLLPHPPLFPFSKVFSSNSFYPLYRLHALPPPLSHTLATSLLSLPILVLSSQPLHTLLSASSPTPSSPPSSPTPVPKPNHALPSCCSFKAAYTHNSFIRGHSLPPPSLPSP